MAGSSPRAAAGELSRAPTRSAIAAILVESAALGSSPRAPAPTSTLMDDELRILHEAMVVKDRLRMLAELQAAYRDALVEHGFDQSLIEQLVLEWSRQAYGITFRSMPEPSMDASLDELLGGVDAADMPEAPRSAGPAKPFRAKDDPSRVPPGEAWLQLVQDDDDADAHARGDEDERAA